MPLPAAADVDRRSLDQVRRQVPRLHDDVVRDDLGDPEIVLEPLRRAAPLPVPDRHQELGHGPEAPGIGPSFTKGREMAAPAP